MRTSIVVFLLACFLPLAGKSEQPYAVIAGGSKGIGFAIAEALAKRGFNLLLIARHEDGLQKARARLEPAYAIRIRTLALDLADTSSTLAIRDFCVRENLPVKMLCNVAGLGGADDFLKMPLDSLRYMIRLNLESVMALTLVMIPLLEKQAPAYILNVSSMAGFAPIPSKNLYAATKSGVTFLSYGLRYQLKDRGISVSYLAPGPVFTKKEIEERTRRQLGWFGMQMAVKPARVGELAVRKTLQGRMVIVPGTLAHLSSIGLRVLPRRWSTAIYSNVRE